MPRGGAQRRVYDYFRGKINATRERAEATRNGTTQDFPRAGGSPFGPGEQKTRGRYNFMAGFDGKTVIRM